MIYKSSFGTEEKEATTVRKQVKKRKVVAVGTSCEGEKAKESNEVRVSLKDILDKHKKGYIITKPTIASYKRRSIVPLKEVESK